jgi:hypothetical protein
MPVVTPSRASIETVKAVPCSRVVLGAPSAAGELAARSPVMRQADQAAAVRAMKLIASASPSARG